MDQLEVWVPTLRLVAFYVFSDLQVKAEQAMRHRAEPISIITAL